MGHTVKRCKQPIKKEEGSEDLENDGGGGRGGDGWEQLGATDGSGQPEWESKNAETQAFGGQPTITVGGSGW